MDRSTGRGDRKRSLSDWHGSDHYLPRRRRPHCIFSIIFSSFVYIHYKSLEHINMISLLGSSVRSNRWSILEPSSSSVIVALQFEFGHLSVRPAGHGQRFASMADGLMRRLTFIAHKSEKLDANCRKAKLFTRSTIGTDAIARKFCESLHPLLCCRHDTLYGGIYISVLYLTPS